MKRTTAPYGKRYGRDSSPKRFKKVYKKPQSRINQLRVAGVENKFLDTSRASTAFTANTWTNISGTSGILNNVLQGDGESNRDGRKYIINSVLVRCPVDQQSTSGWVRFLVVVDTQANGAARS